MINDAELGSFGLGRRIGGAGGGSDPGPRKGARVIIAAAAAVSVAAGGGAIGGGAVGSSAGGSAQSVLARNIGAKKVDARNSVRRGDTKGAWRRMGLRSTKERVERYAECVVHSVGQVRDFLVRNPCRRLDRMLLAVADGDGNVATVAVSWVEFRSRTPARRFRALSDEFGTGYVYPLGGAVRLTGQHYASRLAGRLAVTAEAEPVAGQFDDSVLDAIAEVAAWYPRRARPG